ncbi:MAG: PilZ domain-containing protein [Candidatus Methylomirabilales bacterium]
MWRRFPRHPIRVPVLYSRLDQADSAQTGIGLTENLGEGGACLKLQAELPVGCRLHLFLFTPPSTVDAEARVTAIHARDRDSFYYGVEFVQLAPAYLSALLRALPQEKSLRPQTARLRVTVPASCQVLGATSPPLEGRTANISRTGVMLLLPQALPCNTEVEIRLQPLHTERFRGRVRWVRNDGSGQIRHGVEFLHGPLGPHRFLSLFLDSLPKEGADNLLSAAR